MNGQIKIGTCAWSYPEWRGLFYPPHLPQNQWLEWYARHLPAVEIDSTFYAAPSAETVAHWLEITPADFSFTCKMPREITHVRKLRECGDLVRDFLDSIAPLQPKLGPVLIQLPPSFTPPHDELALKDFLFALPRDFTFAVEFRHRDWHMPRMVKLFEQERICWVWSDTSSLADQNRAPFEFLPQTSGCLYVRLLGDLQNKYHPDGTNAHRYGQLLWPRESALESWAIKVNKHLGDTGCAYLFAANHYEGYAALTAQRIARQFGVTINLPEVAMENEPAPTDPQLDLL